MLNKPNLVKIVSIFFYLLIILLIFIFRYNLDKEVIYITSDGAIKLYQSIQYSQNGLFSLECLYPGKMFDPNYKFFPISYPWIIFQSSDPKCIMEYPPFFFWIGTLFLKFVPIKFLLFIPLFFYGINILIFDFILKKIGLNSIFRVILTTLGFVSFPLLTAMDYTENPGFQSFYLLGFYSFWKITKSETKNIGPLLFTGILFGLAFSLRLEIIIPFSFLCGIYFLFTLKLKNSILIGIGFLIIAILFVFYNLQTSGHPLGFRYVSSLDFNDNAYADLWTRLNHLKAFIWGDKIMIGLFKFHPLSWILLFLPVWAWKKKIFLKNANIFLVSGWISVIAIPLYVTVYGGVGFFGLRYLEPSFFLILIGFAIYLSNEYFSKSTSGKWILIILFIIAGYGNWLSTREGLKILRQSSQSNILLQSILKKSDRIVIHSSLYTSIWMGISFLEKTHINLTGNKEVIEYLKNINSDEKFILLLSPEDIYISSDIPKQLYFRYKTQLDLSSLPIKILEETKLNGVRIVLGKKE